MGRRVLGSRVPGLRAAGHEERRSTGSRTRPSGLMLQGLALQVIGAGHRCRPITACPPLVGDVGKGASAARPRPMPSWSRVRLDDGQGGKMGAGGVEARRLRALPAVRALCAASSVSSMTRGDRGRVSRLGAVHGPLELNFTLQLERVVRKTAMAYNYVVRRHDGHT